MNKCNYPQSIVDKLYKKKNEASLTLKHRTVLYICVHIPNHSFDTFAYVFMTWKSQFFKKNITSFKLVKLTCFQIKLLQKWPVITHIVCTGLFLAAL